MPKMDPHLKEALAHGHDEIVNLRARLAVAEPKAHAYDTIATFARLSVHEERKGMAIDPLWTIRQLLEKDDAEAPE